MVKPICSLYSETGIRLTSASDTYVAIVEAYAPLLIGDIDRVEFSVSVNGGAATVHTVTTRALWKPNDSIYDDPLPGNYGGGPAPLWAFGLELAMSDYAVGYIDIVPTVYSGDGDSTVLDTIRIYNDKGGADSRPSTKEIYWDFINGDDSNSGTSSGDAVKTFEMAVSLAATSNDCGGAIIYIDSAGTHEMGASIGAATNNYTSGDWWLQVVPKAGLGQDDVVLVNESGTDTDFDGTTSGQDFKLRISNVTIYMPGIQFRTSANITLSIWLEHVKCTAPAPYNQPYGRFLHIRAHDYGSGACVSVNSANTPRVRYTGYTRAFSYVGGAHGERIRGVYFEKVAGVVLQPNGSNVAVTNMFLEDLYQDYGISGLFPYGSSSTGQFLTKSLGGDVYRLQSLNDYSTNPYYGFTDIANTAAMLSGSSRLNNIMLQGFSSTPNDTNFEIVGYGYSGSLPYLDISGASIVEEVVSAGRILNGQTSSLGNTYSVWGAHSDIIQFWSGPNNNIMLTNCTVFGAWEGQGLFSSSQDISGFALVNYYDSPAGSAAIGETPRSYFITPGKYYKNILLRNAFVSRMEVDTTACTYEDNEWIDCVFGSVNNQSALSDYAALSTVNVQNMHVMRYAGFAKQGPVGTSPSSGEAYFADSGNYYTGNGGVYNASVATYSDAYQSASSSWSRPSDWFFDDRGPWLNVATADWSIAPTNSEEVTPSPLLNLADVPAPGVSHAITPSPLSGTTSQVVVNAGIRSTPSALSTTSSMPSAVTTANSSDFGLTTMPTIEVDGSEIYSRSSIIVLSENEVPTIHASISDALATVTLGQQATVYPVPYRLYITPSSVTTYTTNNPLEGPRIPPTSRPIFSLSTPASVRSLEAVAGLKDDEVLPILQELTKINNNIANASINSKAIWSEKVIDNIQEPSVSKTIIKINTANYSLLGKKESNPAGKVQTPRRNRY